ncbi:MAG: hypothetical protein LBB55_04620, partial [Zoogloeaceae bacterium]|nr:hypothetical protein [Zoogloeaceae bacterium]
MELNEIDELRAMLPSGRTLFTYAKRQYSLQLLRYALPAPTPVAALRQTFAAPLLQKPEVKAVLAQCGKVLRRAALESHIAYLPMPEHYALGLDIWAPRPGRQRAAQTSRPGANLVLQLNFSHAHNRAFERCVKPESRWELNALAHPCLHDEREGRRYTLAWVRLDIDFDRGEALIEEIQTDWVRRAHCLYQRAQNIRARGKGSLPQGVRGDADGVIEYYERYLMPHREHWDEAMLSAALFFLREELGMRDIWMHTPQSGAVLKRMHDRYWQPPVSLYTDLPQRFCFRKSETLPGFLARERSAI